MCHRILGSVNLFIVSLLAAPGLRPLVSPSRPFLIAGPPSAVPILDPPNSPVLTVVENISVPGTSPDTSFRFFSPGTQPVYCYEKELNQPLTALNEFDCDKAVLNILCADQSINTTPIRWTRMQNLVAVDAPLPFKWTHGTCTVAIDIAEDVLENTVEVASLFEIANAANDVVVNCGHVGYGGSTLAGTDNKLQIFIAGGIDKDWEYTSRCITPNVWRR